MHLLMSKCRQHSEVVSTSLEMFDKSMRTPDLILRKENSVKFLNSTPMKDEMLLSDDNIFKNAGILYFNILFMFELFLLI